jgi:hypothetical protein
MMGPVSLRRRVQISVALGLLAGLRTWLVAISSTKPRDFEQIWFSAQAMLAGLNPYELIGPGRAFEFKFGFFYPLTASVAALPLTPLSSRAACVVFVVFGGGCFAWALMAHGYEPLVGFMGAGMVFAAEMAQWSPLLAAAMAIPPLGVLFAAKPTIGAAVFAARPSWWPIAGGIALCVAAFAFQPDWITAWRGALAVPTDQAAGAAPYLPPVRHPWGWLILLGLLRWRRPEARLVVVLACVPQTTHLYETAPLFLVPRTWREAGFLVIAGYASAIWTGYASSGGTDTTRILAQGDAMVVALYLPCLWMILRRPNEGSVPASLERRIAKWPPWLRGKTSQSSAEVTRDSSHPLCPRDL